MKAVWVILFLALAGLLLAGCAVATAYPEPSPSPMLTEIPSINRPQSLIVTPTTRPIGVTVETPTLFTATLPITTASYTTAVPGPEILDCDWLRSDEAWLHSYFGAVDWTRSTTVTARLTTILPCCGDCPAVIVVRVEDADGEPVEGAAVIFHWSDAPMLPVELRACGLDRGVYGATNEQGNIGFGMGLGSKYFPPDGGPHTLWVGGMSSTCISGIGWLAGTNHEHLDLSYTLGEHYVTLSPDSGFSPFCTANVEDVPGFGEMWVLKCTQ